MNPDVKIILTDQAAKKLEKYKDSLGNKLIEDIASRKFMPGDDEVEITASDIEKGSGYFSRPKLPMFILIVIYLVLGLFMMFLGFNYDIIKTIIHKNDPLQIVLLVMGASFFIMGLFAAMSFMLRDYTNLLAGRMARRRMSIEQ